jgi:hypothetical protein
MTASAMDRSTLSTRDAARAVLALTARSWWGPSAVQVPVPPPARWLPARPLGAARGPAAGSTPLNLQPPMPALMPEWRSEALRHGVTGLGHGTAR